MSALDSPLSPLGIKTTVDHYIQHEADLEYGDDVLTVRVLADGNVEMILHSTDASKSLGAAGSHDVGKVVSVDIGQVSSSGKTFIAFAVNDPVSWPTEADLPDPRTEQELQDYMNKNL